MTPRTKTWTRRELLGTAGAVGAALLVGGCASDGAGAGIDGPRGDAGPTPDGTAGGADGRTLDATPSACDEDTAENILGPFYKAGAPTRSTLVEAGDAGVRLAVSGTVVTAGCLPVAGAVLDVWQADADATYDQVGFKFRGKVTTDAAGAYALATIVPGHYLNGAQYRPAHIHVRVTGPGIEELVTQLYFEGDPYNAIDPFIVESLIMPVGDDGGGGKVATFQFVMRTA